MTGDKSQFLTLEAKEGGTVTFGDNGKGHILGIGKIGTSSSCIENVLYVDGLMHNLLSISQLTNYVIKVFKLFLKLMHAK